jgi:quercetin dioxygenase-like cupin family protein
MLVIALGLCIATTTTIAQDMAKVAPNNVKVILENDHTRVLDVQFKAGEKLPMHSHPGNIIYSFGGGKTKTTLANGKMVDTEFKAGEARWSDAITHANEAVTDIHVLVIEMKEKEIVKKKVIEKTIKKD